MHANASLDEIVAYLDGLLEVQKFASEVGSNGLLHRAGPGVSKIAVALNTSLTTIAGAVKAGAQLLVVHHTSWPGIDLHLHDEKLQIMGAAGLSLYGAHAALDCAPGFSTGWVLAELLGVSVDTTFLEYEGGQAGVAGSCAGTFADLIQRARELLRVEVEAHEHAKSFGRVGIVPGGGIWTSWMDEARRLGCDTYVTGEVSMYTRMFAKECGMNLLIGTHYATEAPAIRALGERLSAHAGIPCEFIAESPDVF
ncbi:MAG: Nif3-like dinuclear metal center hexameric protein [Dehalococcoidia bacterium]